MNIPSAKDAAQKAKDSANKIKASKVFKQRLEVSQIITEGIKLGERTVRLPAFLYPEVKDELIKKGYKLLDRTNSIRLYE